MVDVGSCHVNSGKLCWSNSIFSNNLADIYDDLDAQMEDYGLICECVGGGVIYHEPEQRCIEVLGQSQV